MVWYGIGWSLNLLVAPLLVVGVAFVALGVGTFLSALNVAYRDFRYVIPFMVQFWMFATPVVYPASLVPEGWRWLLYLNPMAGLDRRLPLGLSRPTLRRPCAGPLAWRGARPLPHRRRLFREGRAAFRRHHLEHETRHVSRTVISVENLGKEYVIGASRKRPRDLP